ncbi:MAG: transcriptional regulator [Actinobacteria bacterium 13_2_20CM_2_71_6]|nr:MAG: transcriptional regulator [Actinobacteria bacterium 13_2_20CM_2_71_6]
METIPDLRQYGGADAYLRTCPSRTVLDVLATKWTTLIVPALRGGPVRFGVLRRRLDGITQKSLTQALRSLERDGLVIRTVYPTIPPRVEYALTDLGRGASDLLEAMRHWAEEHMPAILAARTAYDERAELEPQRG